MMFLLADHQAGFRQGGTAQQAAEQDCNENTIISLYYLYIIFIYRKVLNDHHMMV